MFITTQKNRGFTLVETLVAIFLGVFVSIAAISVFVAGLKHIQTARQISYLQSNATFLSNTFDYWIKQGENIELVDSSTLRIVLEGDDKLITRQDYDITINGAPFNDEKVEVLDLQFDKLDNSVQIKFTLKAKNSEEEMSLQTTIAKRNNYAN